MEGQELQMNPIQARSSTPTKACEDSCILLEVAWCFILIRVLVQRHLITINNWDPGLIFSKKFSPQALSPRVRDFLPHTFIYECKGWDVWGLPPLEYKGLAKVPLIYYTYYVHQWSMLVECVSFSLAIFLHFPGFDRITRSRKSNAKGHALEWTHCDSLHVSLNTHIPDLPSRGPWDRPWPERYRFHSRSEGFPARLPPRSLPWSGSRCGDRGVVHLHDDPGPEPGHRQPARPT